MQTLKTVAAALVVFSTAAVADEWRQPGWYIAYFNYGEAPRLVSKPFETEEACQAEAGVRKKGNPDIAIASNVQALTGEFRCRHLESEAAAKKYLFGY